MNLTLKEIIDLWLVWNTAESEPPFRVISPKQVSHFDKKGKRYHDMRAVTKIIERMARDNGLPMIMMDMWNDIHDSVVAYLMKVTNRDGLVDSHPKAGQITKRVKLN